MTVLVTGATGFLGRATVARLAADGMTVRALVRRRDAALPGGVQRVMGDLAGPADLAGLVDGVDTVVHCAAHMGDGDRRRHAAVTVRGTERLLRAAVDARVRRFVHVSTIAVHGRGMAGALLPPDGELEPTPALRDDYAWAKAAAERWVRLYGAETGLETVVLRPGIIYGPGRDFVARVARRLAGPLHLVGGGRRMLLPLVHRDDVVEAIVRVLALAAPPPTPLALVGPDSPTQGRWLARKNREGGRLRTVALPLELMAPLAGWLADRHGAADGRSRLTAFAWTAQAARYDVAPTATALGWTPAIGIDDGVAPATPAPAPEGANGAGAGLQ